VNSNIW